MSQEISRPEYLDQSDRLTGKGAKEAAAWSDACVEFFPFGRRSNDLVSGSQ